MPQARRSSQTARVLKAVAMLGSAQVAGMICSVIRVKLIALWLGPIGTGLNTILLNGASMISTATQLNLRDSAVRDLSLPSDQNSVAIKTAVVRRWALILGALGAIALIIFSPALSASAYSGSFDYTLSFAALAPFVFFSSYSAGEFAILQANDRMKKIARANIVAAISATIFSIPLIYFLRLKSIVHVINLYAIALAVATFFYRERMNTKTVHIDIPTLWREGKSFLKLGAVISMSVLLTALMNYILAAYINSYGGEADLGVYQSGYTLVGSYVGIIFSAIAVEYYPRLTRYINRPRASLTIMTHELMLIIKLVTPVAVVFIACSRWIVKLLYSSQYEGVIPFITFAIIGAVFRGISLCYAYRILAEGDSKAFIVTESISVIVGLTLSIIGYQFGSYLGLGIAYLVWYVFYTALTATVCRIRYNITLPAKTWISAIAGAVACLIAIILWHYVAWWTPLATLLPCMLPSVIRSVKSMRRQKL